MFLFKTYCYTYSNFKSLALYVIGAKIVLSGKHAETLQNKYDSAYSTIEGSIKLYQRQPDLLRGIKGQPGRKGAEGSEGTKGSKGRKGSSGSKGKYCNMNLFLSRKKKE